MDRRNLMAIGGGALMALYVNRHAQGPSHDAPRRSTLWVSPRRHREFPRSAAAGTGKTRVDRGPEHRGTRPANVGRRQHAAAVRGEWTRRSGSRPDSRPDRAGHPRSHAGDEVDTYRDGRRGQSGRPWDRCLAMQSLGATSPVRATSPTNHIKLLQLLKEAIPRLRSVAVFINPTNEAAAPLLKQMRPYAVDLGVQLQLFWR